MSQGRVIQRRRVYEGAVFDLDEVLLREADGSARTRQVVVHGGSVVVLPVMEDGRVVMIRNHRFAIGKPLWELCAGTLEEGEDPAACAARELIEETGYRAAKIEKLCGFYSCPGLCTEYLHGFVATGLVHVGQALDETEQIEVHAMEPQRVRQMLRSGEIEDAKTMAALMYAFMFSTAPA